MTCCGLGARSTGRDCPFRQTEFPSPPVPQPPPAFCLPAAAMHLTKLKQMAGLAKAPPEPQLDVDAVTPLDVIFSCCVCNATFSEVYEGHCESVQQLSDGINPKDRLVTRLFLAGPCCHVFCSKHLEGGGEFAAALLHALMKVLTKLQGHLSIPQGNDRESPALCVGTTPSYTRSADSTLASMMLSSQLVGS